ncbi:LOW QUALITY PROTEIN: uncharacterized protein LOC104681597, partial [Rhinopithecus roxellana]|uniref:LOW QUALITY PROTEIN: uncharacterized protein LOC104681597 n=1 Tax=Rhinopithecus roxellana TaxID=61622 RepID=UPI00123783AF
AALTRACRPGVRPARVPVPPPSSPAVESPPPRPHHDRRGFPRLAETLQHPMCPLPLVASAGHHRHHRLLLLLAPQAPEREASDEIVFSGRSRSRDAVLRSHHFRSEGFRASPRHIRRRVAAAAAARLEEVKPVVEVHHQSEQETSVRKRRIKKSSRVQPEFYHSVQGASIRRPSSGNASYRCSMSSSADFSDEDDFSQKSGSASPAPGDTLPWNLPKHERSKRKIQGGSVLDPAERAVLRIAGALSYADLTQEDSRFSARRGAQQQMRLRALGGRREGPRRLVLGSLGAAGRSGAGAARLSGADARGHLQRPHPVPGMSPRRGPPCPPCPVLSQSDLNPPMPKKWVEESISNAPPDHPLPRESRWPLSRGLRTAWSDLRLCFSGTCCGSQIETSPLGIRDRAASVRGWACLAARSTRVGGPGEGARGSLALPGREGLSGAGD